MQILTLKQKTVIRYGALWDGLSDLLSGPGTLSCNNGIITSTRGNEEKVETVDLSDLTLLPAMIDCHVHLALPYEGRDSLSSNVAGLLQSGIIGVREAGSKKGFSPPKSPLHIANCSQAIYKSGYYGKNLGVAADSIQDAIRIIDRLKSQGVQHIKLITSDIFSFNKFGETGPLPFTAEELHTLTEHAHAQDLSVMAHASGDVAVRRCLFAGVDSVEHGYFMKEDTLKGLVQKGIAWIPTLTPVAVQLDNPELYQALSPIQRETVRLSLKQHMKLVEKGGSLGAKIGAGTDAGAIGVPHGTSLQWEVTYLRNCGIPAHIALQAATSTAATICGFTDLGSLRPGKQAAIMAVRGNPLQYLEVLKNPEFLLIP